MNYIAEINSFQDLVEINQLSTGQIALWYTLMYINNKCSWIEWFTAPSQVLVSRTGLSRKAVYNARNALKQKGYIDFKENKNKTASSYKIYSLQKYIFPNTTISAHETTHDSTHETTHDSTHETTHETTHDSTHETTPLNKRNETIKKTNKKECCDLLFDEFWKAYPRKVNKGSAEKAWMKINPDTELLSKMLIAIERASKRSQWTKDNGQFIPHPATWLNAKGWEDEYGDIKTKSDWRYGNINV